MAASAAEMEELQGHWDALHAAGAGGYTILQSYDWNQVAARIFSQREAPMIVFAESDSGMAIIPACFSRSTKKISLLGETLFDYRDVLHIGDTHVLQSAWNALADEAVKHDAAFEAVALRETPEALQRWGKFELQPFASAPFILRKDASSVQHSRLSRKMRRLSRLGVEMRSYDGSALLLLRTIYRLKAAEPDCLFRDPLGIECILEL